MIVLTDKKLVLAIALGIVALHTLRFFAALATIATGANRLLSDAGRRAFTYMESLIEKIMKAPVEAGRDRGVIQAAGLLLVYRACAFVLLYRAEVTYAIFIIGFFVYAVVYLRLALLFGFIYLGAARLQHIPLTFLDCMVNSLGMPLAYAFFPRNWIIQGVQLVHTFVLILLGVGVLNAYLRRKLNLFRAIAEDVWSILEQEEIQERMRQCYNKAPK
jgi:hypothetical protein